MLALLSPAKKMNFESQTEDLEKEGYARTTKEEKSLPKFLDKYLIKFTENLVEGDVFTTYTGQKVLNGRILKGVKEGKWVEWYETGTKKIEYNLIKGFLSGPIKLWSNKEPF